jgi:alpha-galactosidase
MKRNLAFIIVLILIFPVVAGQKFNNLAPTPPMGWNSWNTFQSKINEQLVRDIADIFERDGYKNAGYNYIIIDDCWSLHERDKDGNLVADPAKFPEGMKALADYVHSKGLKLGIYSDAGNQTCAGYPGSKDHEMQDAQLFASWGIDYLKYDWCSTQGLNTVEAYTKIRDALYAAGRPIVLGICEWGNTQPWLWGKEIGQLWRISGDITPCFDCVVDHGSYKDWGIMKIVDLRNDIRKYAGPNGWNDYDMMEVGNGMTVSEDRAHFSIWCMLSTSLIMGNDLRSASPAAIEILTNKNAIAINQDPLGVQAFKYKDIDSTEVWVKPLKNDEWAICFLNRKKESITVNFNWSDNFIIDPDFSYNVNFKNEKFKILNVWTGKKAGTTRKPLKAVIPVHDVVMLRLSK